MLFDTPSCLVLVKNGTNLCGPSIFKVLKWNTPRFGWSQEDYSGVDSIQLPSSDSWAPDGVFGLILLNAVDEKFMFRLLYL